MTASEQPSMPEVDWLTGLASRAAFARQVNQVDRDRDPFSIALIGIDDFAEVNRQLGYDAGDDLLRAVGRALGGSTSVNTTACRLDGTQFGLLGLQVAKDDVQQWLRPAVTAAKAAVSDWTFDQIDFAGDCPVEPDLMVGVASGFSSRCWVDATTALEVASTHGGIGPVVEYQAEDPRFADLRRRTDEANRITAALDDATLIPMAFRIDLATGGDRDWTWLRLSAGLDEDHPLPSTSELPAGPGRRLEKWLIEKAGATINSAGGLLRVTVPVAREVETGRAFAQRLFPLLERQRIPPSRILFELTESVLLDAGVRGWEFVRQVDKIGSSIVLSDCQGGWQTWRSTQDLPISYIKPNLQLTNQAANGTQAARRIITAMAKNAAELDRELVAPPIGMPEPILADLGFEYLERSHPEPIEAALRR